MEATRSKCALVADDDEDARALLVAMVHRAGFEVLEAVDGQDLIERAQAMQAGGQQLDVVVSDIGMPRRTGIEAVHALRAGRPLLPIVLVTAFTDARTLVCARALDILAVLQKPIDSQKLHGLLLQVVHES